MSIKLILTLATLSLLLMGKAGILADRPALQTTQPLTQTKSSTTTQPLPQSQSSITLQQPQVSYQAQQDNDLDEAGDVDAIDDPDTENELNDDGAQKDQDDETVTAASQPAITLAAAQQIAETYVNAGRARKVELEHEDGKLVYRVHINNVKVQVDATTGAVLEVKTDD